MLFNKNYSVVGFITLNFREVYYALLASLVGADGA